jgi:hypothetical protein
MVAGVAPEKSKAGAAVRESQGSPRVSGFSSRRPPPVCDGDMNLAEVAHRGGRNGHYFFASRTTRWQWTQLTVSCM